MKRIDTKNKYSYQYKKYELQGDLGLFVILYSF